MKVVKAFINSSNHKIKRNTNNEYILFIKKNNFKS